jgi:type II secretory pathway pseudopilin PulG
MRRRDMSYESRDMNKEKRGKNDLPLIPHTSYFILQRKSSERAFTLVELLVSVGIFTLITTAAVFNNNQFNGNVVLSNLAYEIALSIRQAQVYGTTVKQSTQSTFDAGYGINFNLTGQSGPTTYTLFEDRPTPNREYDAGEALETFTIRKGNRISKICVFQPQSTDCTSVTALDISFVRPNPDAYIRSGGTKYTKTEICLASPLNNKRKIIVEATGQLSVSVADSICD